MALSIGENLFPQGDCSLVEILKGAAKIYNELANTQESL